MDAAEHGLEIGLCLLCNRVSSLIAKAHYFFSLCNPIVLPLSIPSIWHVEAARRSTKKLNLADVMFFPNHFHVRSLVFHFMAQNTIFIVVLFYLLVVYELAGSEIKLSWI